MTGVISASPLGITIPKYDPTANDPTKKMPTPAINPEVDPANAVSLLITPVP
jgi:hypothetical protein